MSTAVEVDPHRRISQTALSLIPSENPLPFNCPLVTVLCQHSGPYPNPAWIGIPMVWAYFGAKKMRFSRKTAYSPRHPTLWEWVQRSIFSGLHISLTRCTTGRTNNTWAWNLLGLCHLEALHQRPFLPQELRSLHEPPSRNCRVAEVVPWSVTT